MEETIYVKKRRGKKAKAKRAAKRAAAKKPRAKKAEPLPRSVKALLGYMEGSNMKIAGSSSLARAKLIEPERPTEQPRVKYAAKYARGPATPARVAQPMLVPQQQIFGMIAEQQAGERRQKDLQDKLREAIVKIETSDKEKEAARIRGRVGGGAVAATGFRMPVERFAPLDNEYQPTGFKVFEDVPFARPDDIGGGDYNPPYDRRAGAFQYRPVEASAASYDDEFEFVGGGGGPAMPYDRRAGAFQPRGFEGLGGGVQIERTVGFEDYMGRAPTGRIVLQDKLYKAPRQRRPLPSRKVATPATPVAVAGGGGASAVIGGHLESAEKFRNFMREQHGILERQFKDAGIPVRSFGQRAAVDTKLQALKNEGKTGSQILEALRNQ
jgi:hypothetical protein